MSYDRLNDLRDRFILKTNTSNGSEPSRKNQFSDIYYSRLSRLRSERLVSLCNHRWNNRTTRHLKISRVLDIDGSQSIVIGTVYCEMRLKPNVLDDLAREHHLGAGIGLRKWITAETEKEDQIILEDESGRVRLVGLDRNRWTLVTGIIVGVLGHETERGDFLVKDLIYAGPPTQSSPTPNSGSEGRGGSKGLKDRSLVALVSGLELDGNDESISSIRAQSLVDFLTGQIGDPKDNSIPDRICRLIVVGNSIRSKALRQFQSTISNNSSNTKKTIVENKSNYDQSPIDRLDEFLDQVLKNSNCSIDLMPGPSDPTISTLPQQPIHRCLLPISNRAPSTLGNAKEPAGSKKEVGRNQLVNGPNPWWAKISGSTFLGTSGQNIDDLYKYVLDEDRLKLARLTLEWSHIAPTAPDTLWCYPFKDDDPFVLDRLPDFYFIGNQPKFETDLIKFPNIDTNNERRTRLILLPKFSKTGVVILIDPEDQGYYQVVQLLRDFKASRREIKPSDSSQVTRGDDDGEESDGSEDVDGFGERIVLDMEVDDDDD
ncbi:DNA polymerase delta small subunit [Phakopsora pachyrhizi]|nr:DNA polymerase delta small subunit [Phakopsora pachyrhizi]